MLNIYSKFTNAIIGLRSCPQLIQTFFCQLIALFANNLIYVHTNFFFLLLSRGSPHALLTCTTVRNEQAHWEAHVMIAWERNVRRNFPIASSDCCEHGNRNSIKKYSTAQREEKKIYHKCTMLGMMIIRWHDNLSIEATKVPDSMKNTLNIDIVIQSSN